MGVLSLTPFSLEILLVGLRFAAVRFHELLNVDLVNTLTRHLAVCTRCAARFRSSGEFQAQRELKPLHLGKASLLWDLRNAAVLRFFVVIGRNNKRE